MSARRPSRMGKQPAVPFTDRREERPDDAWYEAHSAGDVMGIQTIRQGFFATKQEMGQLLKSVEIEMKARKILSRDEKAKGALALVQAQRLEAIDAGIERIPHFKNMMTVINSHYKYKMQMCRALRSYCLQRYRQQNKMPMMKKAARRGSPPGATTKPISAPRSESTSNSSLGSQIISIDINGIEDIMTYLPLHLIQDGSALKTMSLPSDEIKARVQPEDLSFALLKDLIAQDFAMHSMASATCPELQMNITNDRHFQMAIHMLLRSGSKLKFVFVDRDWWASMTSRDLATLVS